jgi:Lar family restriction alleviation protein
MPTNELKPCPFCGGDNLYFHRAGKPLGKIRGGTREEWVNVLCGTCGARSKEFRSITETRDELITKAAAAWNRREGEGNV